MFERPSSKKELAVTMNAKRPKLSRKQALKNKRICFCIPLIRIFSFPHTRNAQTKVRQCIFHIIYSHSFSHSHIFNVAHFKRDALCSLWPDFYVHWLLVKRLCVCVFLRFVSVGANISQTNSRECRIYYLYQRTKRNNIFKY